MKSMYVPCGKLEHRKLGKPHPFIIVIHNICVVFFVLFFCAVTVWNLRSTISLN